MTIQKALKSILLAAVLISTIPYTNDTQAVKTYPYQPMYKPIYRRSNAPEIIGSVILVAGAAAICAGIVALKAHFSYQQGLEQCKILENFRDNPYYDYENLTKDARNQYYDQWAISSTSLSSDYPVVWLEKSATSNKNFLAWMFFNKASTDLSAKLNAALKYLRSISKFQTQKKEYNDKYREQAYRDEKLSIEREKLDIKKEERRDKQPDQSGSRPR